METIGGFRLVRRLGSGQRADVHLGHPIAPSDEPRSSAIKVFRPSTSSASIDNEVEALARSSSRFLVRLDDLTMTADGRPALILQRVEPLTLSRLCWEHGTIGNGEATTILAPLADAVEELHRVGVAHGKLRLSTVHFDDAGAPVIVGFGAAMIIGPFPSDSTTSSVPPVVLDASAAAHKDLDDLRAVARAVIECTMPSEARASLIEWLAASHEGAAFCDALRERLFDFAEPTPVQLSRPATVGRPPSPVRELAGAATDGPPDPRPRWFDLFPLPPWLEDLAPRRMARTADRDPSDGEEATDGPEPSASRRLSVLAERVRAFLASVRRPVWITAGVIAVLLVTAMAMAGTDDDDPSATGAGSGRPTLEDGTGSPDVRSGPHESGDQSAGPDRQQAIRGPDPVAAVAALAAERNRCFEQRSVLCLDGVDQASSAAMEADTYAMGVAAEPAGAAREGAIPADQPDFTIGSPALIEELGGSAIVAIRFDGPAASDAPVEVTVLVVRGETGWRIRDLVLE